MELQYGCRDCFRHFPFYHFIHGIRLVCSARQNEDFLCLHNLFYPHRERLTRHFGDIVKQARIVLHRALCKRDNMRAARKGRARFVERDVPVAAKPQQLDVARELFKECVVAGTLLCLVCRHAVFDVRVLGVDVQSVKQILAHEVGITLFMRFRQALVLIEVDRAKCA